MDIYSFDFKLGHIAKHVQLPPVPQLGDMSGLPREERLPPLLVVNIQLPDYPVSGSLASLPPRPHTRPSHRSHERVGPACMYTRSHSYIQAMIPCSMCSTDRS